MVPATKESKGKLTQMLGEEIIRLSTRISELEIAKKELVASHTDTIKHAKKRLKLALNEYKNPTDYLFEAGSVEEFFLQNNA
jgi:hypothetical protein